MVEGTGGARGAAPGGRAEAPAHLIQGDGRPSSEEAVCEEPAATFRVPGSVAGSAPHFPSHPRHAPTVPSSVTPGCPVSAALSSFSLGPIDPPSRPSHVLVKKLGWRMAISNNKRENAGKRVAFFIR